MRHRKNVKTLDRKRGPRKALLRGLATNLILFEKIKTTEAKAKTIKPIIEKLVTKAKTNTLATRRQLKQYLYVDNSVKKILEVLGPRYKERKGGYTRIIKLSPRQGDAAKMAIIEFV